MSVARIQTPKPLVEISDNGVGLVIPWPSNVVYVNQTTGYHCFQSHVEGVYVPLDSYIVPKSKSDMSDLATKLFRYFEGPPHKGWGAPDGITEKDADFIDSVLHERKFGEAIAVDRDRLKESHEAWVYVKILGDVDEYLLHFEPYPREAILTWPNTD